MMADIWTLCLFLLHAFRYSLCTSELQFGSRSVCLHTYGTVLSSVTAVGSHLGCATICKTEAQCSSALYDLSTEECVTNTDTSQHIGDTSTCARVVKYIVVLERPCSGNSDCSPVPNSECLEGVCQCINGYSLSPSEGTCTPMCATYGDTFRKYPTLSLIWLNNDKLEDVTLEACLQACIQATDFVCRSAEYDTVGHTCQLSSETVYTEPDEIEYHDDWLLAHRNCA